MIFYLWIIIAFVVGEFIGFGLGVLIGNDRIDDERSARKGEIQS